MVYVISPEEVVFLGFSTGIDLTNDFIYATFKLIKFKYMSTIQNTKLIEQLREEVEELGGDTSNIKGSEIEIINQLKKLICELQ